MIGSGLIEAVGLMAALLSAGSFLPQVLKIFRTRETAGVSQRTYVLTAAASVLWITYGVGIASVSVVLCNVVLGSLALTIVLLKLRFG